jgi:hypothetical protein
MCQEKRAHSNSVIYRSSFTLGPKGDAMVRIIQLLQQTVRILAEMTGLFVSVHSISMNSAAIRG